MTQGSAEDDFLVLVRAQVMTRDDSTGGWLPMEGGGLSHVTVVKQPLPTDSDATKHEYIICGKRISDDMIVLSCTIKKDFQYNKVMPTFHHWVTGNKKFGLTFLTAADARAFDKGVRMAVDNVLEGSLESTQIHDADVGDDDVFMAIDLPVERGDSQSSSGSSSVGGYSSGGNNCSGSLRPSPVSGNGGGGSTSCGGGSESQSAFTHSHANHHYFHRMHYIAKSPPPQQTSSRVTSPTNNNNNGVTSPGTNADVHHHHLPSQLSLSHQSPRDMVEVWTRNEDQRVRHSKPGSLGPLYDGDKIEISPEPYPYVQLSKDQPLPPPSSHDYSYPMMDTAGRGGAEVLFVDGGRRDGGVSTVEGGGAKRPLRGGGDAILSQPTLLPTKSKTKQPPQHQQQQQHRGKKRLLPERSRCRYCHETFNEEDNVRGSCEYAPDGVRSCINTVTCLTGAQCMLYHCMSDSEGDYPHPPCSCDRTDEHCSRRWLGLAVLSFFLPCLWCYVPLNSCHRCGVAYGVCGGRHVAS